MDWTIDFWESGSYNTYIFFPGPMAAFCGVKAAGKSVNRKRHRGSQLKGLRAFSAAKESSGVFVFPPAAAWLPPSE